MARAAPTAPGSSAQPARGDVRTTRAFIFTFN